MRSVYVIVMDSVGVGAAPDAERFGDAGADTFSHVIEGEDLSQIDLLLSLGMKKLCHPPLEGEVTGVWGKMQEKSAGKDTTSGHWELCGLVTEKPMPTYPNGFPKRIIDKFERETGRKVIGNKAASRYGNHQRVRGGAHQNRCFDCVYFCRQRFSNCSP